MKVTENFHNIMCDSCKALLDPCDWYDDEDAIAMVADDCNWKHFGGSDYCPDCYAYDEDGHIRTNDGRIFAEDGTELTDRTPLMTYLCLDGRMTLTQFRTELTRGEELCHSMVGTLHRSILANDLHNGWEWFNMLLGQRKGTPEYDRYITFLCHGIFRREAASLHDRLANRQ